jgi:hypothetical protein
MALSLLIYELPVESEGKPSSPVRPPLTCGCSGLLAPWSMAEEEKPLVGKEPGSEGTEARVSFSLWRGRVCSVVLRPCLMGRPR